MFQKLSRIFLICICFICSVGQINAANVSVSPLKHEMTVNAGQTKTEKIRITNPFDTPITVYTSKEDFISGDDSGTPVFVPIEKNTNPELSLTNWIKLGEDNITLAPRESREIIFSITVPGNGEPGGHYGAIFFTPEATGGQVMVIQRLGVLILVDVPGEVQISGNFKDTLIGQNIDGKFVERSDLNSMPVVFSTVFENTGNIHLKPKGIIEIFDDEGNLVKNVGKEPLTTPEGAYIGEKMVDYLPINAEDGNALPHSERKFLTNWEGIAYMILDEETGERKIEFKSLSDYYANEMSKMAKDLKFWEQVKSKNVNKKFTASISTYYEGKDKSKKEFKNSKEFYVKYEESYVGYNTIFVSLIVVIILSGVGYFVLVAPKQRKKKEEELRQKIMDEMKNNNK